VASRLVSFEWCRQRKRAAPFATAPDKFARRRESHGAGKCAAVEYETVGRAPPNFENGGRFQAVMHAVKRDFAR
jgi:hypothetical protein